MTRTAVVRLAAAVTVLTAAGVPHATAASSTTQISYEGCRELTALLPATGLGTSGGLAVVAAITFVCDEVQVGQQPVGPAGVCEVLALQPDRSSRLLRTATDNRPLQQALLHAGLPSARATHVQVDDKPVSTSSVCTVLAEDRRELTSRLTAAAGAAPTLRSRLANGTLVHHHTDASGRRTTTTYDNDLSRRGGKAGGGAGLLDASADDALAGWLGREQAAGAVVAVRGDWTATVQQG